MPTGEFTARDILRELPMRALEAYTADLEHHDAQCRAGGHPNELGGELARASQVLVARRQPTRPPGR
jgi:hypothetical protein